MVYSELETQFNDETDAWLVSNLGITQDWKEPLYHLTNPEGATSIIDSQIFRASFIRSTSDPLEYALPLSEIRNWVCFSHQLWSNFEKPHDLFDHFNMLATNPYPQIRPYFISMVKKPNDFLQERYGRSIVEVKKIQDNIFKDSSFIVPISYYENIQANVWKLLLDWRNNVLLKVRESFSAMPEKEFINKTFYLWMKLFTMFGLSIKRSVYENEQEVRLIVFPGTPDQDMTWFNKRCIKPSDQKKPGDPRNEYLPIKVEQLGLKANLIS